MVKRAAKTRTEVPTLGELRVGENGVMQGRIKGACGCDTWFEVCVAARDEGGVFHRLVGLSDAKARGKSGAESEPAGAP